MQAVVITYRERKADGAVVEGDGHHQLPEGARVKGKERQCVAVDGQQGGGLDFLL